MMTRFAFLTLLALASVLHSPLDACNTVITSHDNGFNHASGEVKFEGTEGLTVPPGATARLKVHLKVWINGSVISDSYVNVSTTTKEWEKEVTTIACGAYIGAVSATTAQVDDGCWVYKGGSYY